MTKKLIERYKYSLVLLRELAATDFKLRYQGSVLGYAWSLLRPLFLFVILYVVFAKFLKIGDAVPHYPVYLLLGIVLWNYFNEITTGNVSAIVGKGDLIRKLNFPKYVIILSGCVSAMINLALNFVVIGVFMVLTGVDISIDALWTIPLLFQLTFFALGLAFLLSTLFVRFRDIAYIWEVIMQAAFYATPIIYPLSLVPEAAQKLLLLNPVAQVIQDMRHALVTPETIHIGTVYTSAWVWLIPLGITLITGIVGMWYFKKRSPYFAEDL